MNKKFSTLLTAGLLVSGSLFSSAFAADQLKIGDLVQKLEGGKYHLVMNDAAPSTSQWAYGFTGYNANTGEITESVADIATATSDGVDPEAYLWTVSTASILDGGTVKTGYTLTNVKTGKTLRFNAAGSPVLNTNDDAVSNVIAFGNEIKKYDATDAATTFANAEWIWVVSTANAGHSVYLRLNGQNLMSQNPGFVFNFYKAADETVSGGVLNELYNSNGFNLKLADKYKDVANIFADQRIKAIEVSTAITVETGYTYPTGTYFAVSTPAGSYQGLTGDDALSYLQACEFIVVSPTENVSADNGEKNSGYGFTFTTVSGKDLNKYTVATNDASYDARKAATGDEVSVYNAIFKVTKNNASASSYKLELPTFRYQKADGSYNQKSIGIALAERKYGSATYLCTQSTATTIFSYVEANVVKGTEFLNEEGVAAIYNIQFASGANDATELDKYLYASAYNNTLYAKGLVLTDTDLPEFQFIVTEVSGNNVTFTNRANNSVKFTTQLFDEGDGVYSLSINSASTTKQFTVLNIEATTNNVVKAPAVTDLNLKHVKLSVPESTDKLNGTVSVNSGAIVSLSFARDNAPSSNKLYATVDATRTGYAFAAPSYSSLEAAQLQLVKDDTKAPTYRTLTYAYRVGSGDEAKVKFVTKGDTIAYYSYQLQLIIDGEETGYYLKSPAANTTTGLTSAYTFTQTTGTEFVIKENVDGSYAIMQSYVADEGLFINYWKADQDNDLGYYIRNAYTPVMRDFTEEMKSHYIKTYLASETPAVSWPAEDGYVSFLSDKGNYISMDDDRDGLVVKADEQVFKLNAADTDALIPTFFISKYVDGTRYYMYNPTDSLNYYIAPGDYDKQYQVSEDATKIIFKEGELNETADIMTTMSKGQLVEVAEKANNKGVKAGLKNFKFQLLEDPYTGYYRIRCVGAKAGENYLAAINGKLIVGAEETQAQLFEISETDIPTSNESVAASEVSVVAVNGAIIVKGAAGKVVTVANILGQTIANQVAASDNVTIAAPAGIAVVTVDGEATKVVVK